MDAPPTQYRVIEKDRKLIVLDAATNLPPKQACDIHPAGHGLQAVAHAAADDAPPRPMRNAKDRSSAGPKKMPGAGLFIFVAMIVVAMTMGGVTGFIVGVAAIVIAGNIMMKKTPEKARR